ncbi:MAG: TonB-dependent receptor [Pseudomonadota bacterium]
MGRSHSHDRGRRRARRRTSPIMLAGALTFAIGAMPGTPAQAQGAGDTRDYAIAAGPLDDSLSRLAREAGITLSYDPALAEGETASALTGRYTTEEALAALLAGTGLRHSFADADTVTVQRIARKNGEGSDDGGPILLNELTVTARRFEESLLDVPGSVTVLSDQEIERSNITDLNDIVLRAPNVNYIEGGAPTDAQLSIRGLSNLISASGTGPTNGVYIDEVIINPTGRNTGLDPSLFDLERVEILYGPQGTTFGRGAIGGAINYVTKKPTSDFEASLEAEVGSFPDGGVRGFVNGGLLRDDLLNARLSFFGRAADGFIDTPNLDEDQGLDTSDFGARLALRSEPTERLTIDWSGAYERNNYVDSTIATEESILANDPVYLPNEEGDVSADRLLTSLRADYELDVGTVTSLTSFFFVEEDAFSDTDVSPFDGTVADFSSETRSIAQEFRFSSEKLDVPVIGPTSFIVGTNFSFNRDETEATSIAGSDFGPPTVPFFPFPLEGTSFSTDTRTVTNVAVFGDVIFEPIDRLELGAGARFNYDRVEVDSPADIFTGNVGLVSQAPFAFADSETFTGVSPKGSARYAWTEDFSTYVAISTGYRSGGFNTGAPSVDLITFEEEKAINYEGGFRSTWLDGRLTVNGTGFATFYRDLQTFSTVPVLPMPVVLIENAARARSVGAEMSFRLSPIEGLVLGVDYGLAKTKFVEFEDSLVGDVTGESLPNAPVHTASVIGDYALPVFDDRADVFLRGEYSYTSDYFNGIGDSLINGESFGPRNIINLRTGVRAEDFEVELFVENLLDEIYQTGESSGISASLFGSPRHGEIGPRRRFGVRARVFF